MAADRLVPKDLEEEDEQFLEPDEVLRRLRAEFPVVEINQDYGREMVQERIDFIERRSSEGLDPWLENDKTLERLRCGINSALGVYFADEPDAEFAYLTTVVMQNEPLFFGYTSDEHQQNARPLLKRAAKALGYDIEK
jgi:hypothetical protein